MGGEVEIEMAAEVEAESIIGAQEFAVRGLLVGKVASGQAKAHLESAVHPDGLGHERGSCDEAEGEDEAAHGGSCKKAFQS
jgi:hypothetical protein